MAIGMAQSKEAFIQARRVTSQVLGKAVCAGLGILGVQQVEPDLLQVGAAIHGVVRRIAPQHGEVLRAAPLVAEPAMELPGAGVRNGDDGLQACLAAGQSLGPCQVLGHIAQDGRQTTRHAMHRGQGNLCSEQLAVGAAMQPMEALRLPAQRGLDQRPRHFVRGAAICLYGGRQFHRALAHQHVRRCAEHPLGARIGGGKNTLIDEQNAVVGALHHGLEFTQVQFVGTLCGDVNVGDHAEMAVARIDQAAIHLAQSFRPAGILQARLERPHPTPQVEFLREAPAQFRVFPQPKRRTRCALLGALRVTKGGIPGMVPERLGNEAIHKGRIGHGHRRLLHQRQMDCMALFQRGFGRQQVLFGLRVRPQFAGQFAVDTHQADREQHQPGQRIGHGRKIACRAKIQSQGGEHHQSNGLCQKDQAQQHMPHARLTPGSTQGQPCDIQEEPRGNQVADQRDVPLRRTDQHHGLGSQPQRQEQPPGTPCWAKHVVPRSHHQCRQATKTDHQGQQAHER